MKMKVEDKKMYEKKDDVEVKAEYIKPAKKTMSNKKINAIKSLLMSTYTLIILITYIILGIFLEIWHPLWLIFLSIPIYGSLVEAILRKKAWIFSIEMVAISAFVTIGFLSGVWHPTWVIILLIPVYRTTLSSISKIKHLREED